MSELDAGDTRAGKQLNGLSSFGAEIDNPYGHEQHLRGNDMCQEALPAAIPRQQFRR